MGDIPVAKPSPIPRTLRFPRRGFVIALVLGGFFALAAVIVTAAYPTGSNVDNGPHWVSVYRFHDLQTDTPVHIFDQKLCLVKLNTGQVIALSHEATTARPCVVPYRPDFLFDNRKGWFRDPCSGATWDLNGYKVYGPASRGLDQYQVQISGGGDVQVYVNSPLIQNSPDEAKPYLRTTR